MPIQFTDKEIQALQRSPEVMRILAEWRDHQQFEADQMMIGTTGDRERAIELRREALRMEIDKEF